MFKFLITRMFHRPTPLLLNLACSRKSLVTVSKLIDHQTDLNSVTIEGEIPGDIKNSNVAKPQFVEQDLLNYSDKGTNNMLPASSKPGNYTKLNHPITNIKYCRGMPLYKEGEVNKYDIGHYVQTRVNSKNIFEVIENLWKPDYLNFLLQWKEKETVNGANGFCPTG